MSAGGRAPAASLAAVAVDLGGTKTTVGLVTEQGVQWVRTVPTPARDGAAAVLSRVARLVDECRSAAAESDAPVPAFVGVGSAGVLDAKGVVTAATDALPGWVGTPVAARLEQAAGLPVVALNDVHAHALGEATAGAGRGADPVLLVAAGTGVGGALVVSGQPLVGARGVAGHVGHVPAEEAAGLPCPCGRIGHLEAVASGPGLHALHGRLGGRSADAREVGVLAEACEPRAAEAVRLAGAALGRAIGGLVNALDPQVVVLTGGLAEAGPTWWRAVRAGAERETMDVVADTAIVPAALGANAALIGAAAHAHAVLHPGDGAWPPASVGARPASSTRVPTTE